MKNLVTVVGTTFGIAGILSAMYWAMLNARFGLIGKLFGQKTLDWVNTKMSVINDILPYIVFAVAFSGGVLWLGYTIYEKIRKRKHVDMSREEIVEKIIELLNKLK